MEIDNYIKIPDLKERHVYRIHSRNLDFGIYYTRGSDHGFLGIREKFKSKYLFTEYHWDGESFATVRPLYLIEKVPDSFVIKESLGTECYNCKVNVDWTTEKKWVHLNQTSCQDAYPVSIQNKEVFDYLMSLEEKYKDEVEKDNEEIYKKLLEDSSKIIRGKDWYKQQGS